MTNRESEPLDEDLSLEALVREYQSALLRYAYRMVRNWDLAQDLVQETFLRYIRSPLQYGEDRQRAAWFFRVLRNLCIDVLKRESRREVIHDKARKPPTPKTPEELIEHDERRKQLHDLMEQLNENQRTVLLLFFQEQYSYKEIADITGFSMSNVGMLIHRGLRKLRDLMEEEK